MDENKPPEEPIVTPEPTPDPIPDPTPASPPPSASSAASTASNVSSFMADATSGTGKGGPVPFADPADPSVPAEQKTQALLVWVLMFVISFISPLVFYFVANDKPFVKHHAATALSLVITAFGIGIVMFILAFILALAGPLALLVFPLWGVISLCFLAVIIMGAIAANAGSRYTPPIIGKIRDMIFKA